MAYLFRFLILKFGNSTFKGFYFDLFGLFRSLFINWYSYTKIGGFLQSKMNILSPFKILKYMK
jgi:hypothetical protein